MATTTTNFGWDIPQSTDLVKDGATAIAALGQDIDTAFVDLKGGTTGQVLAKASNTDLDYTWVAQDDSNAIQNAIVDAKGDLIAASAADTPARLAVGNNGETLVADSSTSTGLRYQGTQAAGKNALINGNFDIWQRGTSSSTLGAYTTADRWFLTAISGSGTFAQEATVKPSNSNYSLKFTASATSQPLIYQVIETSNALQFAGQNVVLSGKFASSASVTFSLSLEWSASTDVGVSGSWTSITPSSTSAASPTSTTFVDGRAVFAIPSTARSLRVGILPTATIANGVVLYWSQIQLELGSIPTFFTRAGGTIQGELAACQRYYYEMAYSGAEPYGSGAATNTTSAVILTALPVSMRVVPTAVYTGTFRIEGGASKTGIAAASLSLNQAQNQQVLTAVTSSSLTAGWGFVMLANGSSAIKLSAEL